ncbi:MAG: hypothetical protein GY941_10715, partial [Planctomycetes bacterium]|nr:hypothetical protein [Planctomycetota bacterium]
MPRPYTPQEDAIIKDKVMQNFSASQIAKDIGRSRNSVVGRCHRMGFNKLKPVQRKKKKKLSRYPNPRKLAVAPPLPPSKPKEYTTDPGSKNITLLDLEYGQCKWPTSNLSPHVFC